MGLKEDVRFGALTSCIATAIAKLLVRRTMNQLFNDCAVVLVQLWAQVNCLDKQLLEIIVIKKHNPSAYTDHQFLKHSLKLN